MSGKCIATNPAARPELENTLSPHGLSLDVSSIVRRIGRNAGLVLSGNGVAVALGFFTLALNARALGVSDFGTLVLITSVGGLLDRLFALQSWQAVVKLGSEAITSGDRSLLRQLIAAAFLFDLGTALTASLAGIAIALTAAGWVGIDSAHASFAAVYMATLSTRIVDAPMGVLRLHNRFGTIIAVQIAGSALSFLLAGILFVLDAPLSAYILGLAGVAVASNLLMCGAGLRIARLAGSFPAWPRRDAVGKFWSFSWATGLSATIGTVREQGLVLMIGAMLGPPAAGIYHIAVRIAAAIGLVTHPLGQAIFPEAARLSASGRYDDLHRIVICAGLAGGGLGIASLVAFSWFGADLILLVSGPDYNEAHVPLVIITAGYSLALVGIGMRSAVITGAGPKPMLACNLIGLVAIILAPLAIARFGLEGAAAAYACFDGLWLLAAGLIYSRQRLIPNRNVGKRC